MSLHTVIIGAGISGLVQAVYLKKITNQFVIIDLKDNVGGYWYHQNNFKLNQASRNERTSFPKDIIALSNFPIPNEYPIYLNQMQMFSYLYSYWKYHQLEKHTLLKTKVLKITKNNDLYTIKTTEGYFTTKNIINAVGFSKNLNINPPNYKGKVYHTTDIKTMNLNNIKNQTILIWDYDDSINYLIPLLTNHNKVLWSLPNGIWFIPQWSFGSREKDQVQPYLYHLNEEIISNGYLEDLLQIFYGKNGHGLKIWENDSSLGTSKICYQYHLLDLINNFKLIPTNQVLGIKNKNIVFKNGIVMDIDIIITCSGSLPNYHFLPKPYQLTPNKLFKRTIHPIDNHIMFIGNNQISFGYPEKMIELQAIINLLNLQNHFNNLIYYTQLESAFDNQYFQEYNPYLQNYHLFYQNNKYLFFDLQNFNIFNLITNQIKKLNINPNYLLDNQLYTNLNLINLLFKFIIYPSLLLLKPFYFIFKLLIKIKFISHNYFNYPYFTILKLIILLYLLLKIKYS